MPKLIIIDDDLRKVALCPEVNAHLARSYPDEGWSIAHGEALAANSDWDTILAHINDDAVLLVDIELKRGTTPVGAADSLRARLSEELASAFDAEVGRLMLIFGDDDEYKLSVGLLAYANALRVPAIVISTKSDRDSNPHSLQASTSRLPVVANWAETWSDDWSTESRPSIIGAIAGKVRNAWLGQKGSVEARLWPQHAACWMRDQGTEVPHAFPAGGAHTAAYTSALKKYTENILGEHLPANWVPSEGYHEVLKHHVGACARAHEGMDYVPTLGTVALLAAVWDPCASQWFGAVAWSASTNLLPSHACRQQARDLLLAIGGEDGLFRALFVHEGPARETTLESVEQERGRLTFNLAIDLTVSRRDDGRGIKQKWEDYLGSSPTPVTGNVFHRLVRVSKLLAVAGPPVINIEVGDNVSRFVWARVP